MLSFRARRNVRIPRIYTKRCACAHGRGARQLPTQPKQLLAHLRVRAAESCCSLLQVHPSEAKKLLGRCFRLVWNIDRRLGFNKVSPNTRPAYFPGGLYYCAIRPSNELVLLQTVHISEFDRGLFHSRTSYSYSSCTCFARCRWRIRKGKLTRELTTKKTRKRPQMMQEQKHRWLIMRKTLENSERSPKRICFKVRGKERGREG